MYYVSKLFMGTSKSKWSCLYFAKLKAVNYLNKHTFPFILNTSRVQSIDSEKCCVINVSKSCGGGYLCWFQIPFRVCPPAARAAQCWGWNKPLNVKWNTNQINEIIKRPERGLMSGLYNPTITVTHRHNIMLCTMCKNSWCHLLLSISSWRGQLSAKREEAAADQLLAEVWWDGCGDGAGRNTPSPPRPSHHR